MRYSLILLLVVGLIACKDDAPKPVKIDTSNAQRVLCINEGNFQWGNASLGVYLPEKEQYVENVFKDANGIPVGDVFNSISLINGRYWCVINNSGLIHILDTTTLKIEKTVKGFKSPRYAADAGNDQVYVTDLYANGVYVVSTKTYEITQKIHIQGWTEHLLFAGARMYITNNERPYVFIVNPENNKVVDSLSIGNLSNSMLRADNATILILCEGKLGSSELAELYRIDPKARQVTGSYAFNAGEKPRFLRQNPSDNKVYLINNGLFILDGWAYTMKEKLLETPTSVYAFNISKSGDFYIGDAKDYVQNSQINVYSGLNYGLLKSFKAGVNTNGFYFE